MSAPKDEPQGEPLTCHGYKWEGAMDQEWTGTRRSPGRTPIRGLWSKKADQYATCRDCPWSTTRSSARSLARGHARANPGHHAVVRYQGDITYWT